MPRLERRPLEWDLTPVQALRLVRADTLPVALFGTWAGGSDVIAAEPLLTRAAPATSHALATPAATPGGLADVLDAPYPSGLPLHGTVPDGAITSAFGGGWIGYLGYSAAGE